jgi:hypothetical protein
MVCSDRAGLRLGPVVSPLDRSAARQGYIRGNGCRQAEFFWRGRTADPDDIFRRRLDEFAARVGVELASGMESESR